MRHVVLSRRGGPVCPPVVGILNLPNMGGKRTMFLVSGHMCRSVVGCWDLSTTHNVCKTLRRAHNLRPYAGGCMYLRKGHDCFLEGEGV